MDYTAPRWRFAGSTEVRRIPLTELPWLHSILGAFVIRCSRRSGKEYAAADGARVFTGEEKRRHPRYGFQADVEIEIEGKAFRAVMTDISAAGMFVVAANPLWVGAVFTARIHVAEPLRVKCQVKRVMVGRGMGVSFQDLTAQDRESLDKILAGLAV
jgi:hypothetical protein